MQRTIEETSRRRQMQEEYNREHGITPESIRKAIRSGIESEAAAHAEANAAVGRDDDAEYITEEYINELEAEMYEAAEALEFERAGAIRDRIEQLQESIGKKVNEVELRSSSREKRSSRRKGKGKGKGRRDIPRPKKA